MAEEVFEGDDVTLAVHGMGSKGMAQAVRSDFFQAQGSGLLDQFLKVFLDDSL